MISQGNIIFLNQNNSTTEKLITCNQFLKKRREQPQIQCIYDTFLLFRSFIPPSHINSIKINKLQRQRRAGEKFSTTTPTKKIHAPLHR